jgi:hypothetical protein
VWCFNICIHFIIFKSGQMYHIYHSLWWKHSESFLLAFWNV